MLPTRLNIGTVFFTLGVFSVGALALGLPKGYSIGFYLISFASLFLWLKCRDAIVPLDVKGFAVPILLYAGVQLAIYLYHEKAIREVGNYLTFVWGLFGIWGIRKYKPKAEIFWMGLVVGAALAALLSGYEAIVLGQRAGGFANPIQFGNIALLIGVLCLVKALSFDAIGVRPVIYWVGVFSGIAASVWSQTRGGWIAILLIFGWIIVVATKGWSRLKKYLLFVAAIALFVALLLQPNSTVNKRIVEAVNEFNAYLVTGKDDSAVGARLAMWWVAIGGVDARPWLGGGAKGWIELRDAAIEEGRLGAFSSGFNHVHNEYIDIAVKHGLIGLFFHLVLMLGPMLLFFGPHKSSSNPEVRSLAIAGMVVPMMYMDFGLTQTFLSHNSGRVVLSALWMCLAALMLNALEEDRQLLNKKVANA
jgi:O-antigen ligase